MMQTWFILLEQLKSRYIICIVRIISHNVMLVTLRNAPCYSLTIETICEKRIQI